MITPNQVKKGIDSGVIKFIVDPNLGEGTVCKIGENWFYFDDNRAESMNPDEYRKTVSSEEIAESVHAVLTEFAHLEDFVNEYDYYEAILKESGITA